MKNYMIDLSNKTITLENMTAEPKYITENTLVVDVFTDFRSKAPIFITEEVSVDKALEIMKTKHVRCLFIVNPDEHIVGVISSRILSDHYILEFMAKHNIASRKDVLAKNIMVKKEDIHAIDYQKLLQKQVTIKDILEAFYDLHERHIFVTESVAPDNIKIIGIISAADISRKMHISIDVNLETVSFSNLLKYMNF